jgi:hypothetical protein
MVAVGARRDRDDELARISGDVHPQVEIELARCAREDRGG